jgi:hypothetical protein
MKHLNDAKHKDGFYYILFDTEWTSPLGEPITIEIETTQ